MKYVLASLCIVLCTCVNAQYKLFVKNADSTKIEVRIGTSTVDIRPGMTEEIPVHTLTQSPKFVVKSIRGEFSQGNASTDTPLTPGEYILIFMWNTKNNAWRTVIRPRVGDD